MTNSLGICVFDSKNEKLSRVLFYCMLVKFVIDNLKAKDGNMMPGFSVLFIAVNWSVLMFQVCQYYNFICSQLLNSHLENIVYEFSDNYLISIIKVK